MTICLPQIVAAGPGRAARRTVLRLPELVLAGAVFALVGCASNATLDQSGGAFRQSGQASYYGPRYHGRITASGEVFDQNGMTASHRRLAFGSRVKVTNTENGRSVIVRINDRGPFVRGRVIDLSKAAFAEIADPAMGLAPVALELAK